jgi:outer membrane lipoprotein-sorting protein
MNALIALSLVALVAAADDPAGRALDDLVAASNDIQSMEAGFTQVTELKAFKQPVTSTGTLRFTRNGKIVWSYEAPHRMDFTIEGSKARLVYPDFGEEQEFDLDTNEQFRPMMESMFVWLGGDPSVVREAYEISLGGENNRTLELRPRSEMIRKFVARILITFDEKHVVQQVHIEEPDGDATRISFEYRAVDRG